MNSGKLCSKSDHEEAHDSYRRGELNAATFYHSRRIACQNRTDDLLFSGRFEYCGRVGSNWLEAVLLFRAFLGESGILSVDLWELVVIDVSPSGVRLRG